MSEKEPLAAQEALAVDTDEASRLLGLRPQTLRQMRSEGRGPKFVHVSNNHSKVLYPMDELKAWLSTRK